MKWKISGEPFEFFLKVLDLPEEFELLLLDFELVGFFDFEFLYLVFFEHQLLFSPEILDQSLDFRVAFLGASPWVEQFTFKTVVAGLQLQNLFFQGAVQHLQLLNGDLQAPASLF
jgi:hypothetical protein